MKNLLPLVLLFIGTGAGLGAGMFLRPEPPQDALEASGETAKVEAEDPVEDEPTDREYVRMSNQFVVPVIKQDLVDALVVMSLSVEVPTGQKDVIYSKEPKLRDSFLQVLFDHANIGGFDGAFTNANNLAVLRGAIREAAQKDMGDQVTDVLIIEIARQYY